MFVLNGNPISPDMAFTAGDIQYPANWLRLASIEEREAIGITEVPDPVPFDNRFYWSIDNPKLLDDREEVDQDGNPLYTKVLVDGEMVDSTERLVTKGLKSQWITQIKDTANKLLSDTDWTIIRMVERSVDVPASVVVSRAAIIAETSRLATAISGATTVEELITVISSQNWTV